MRKFLVSILITALAMFNNIAFVYGNGIVDKQNMYKEKQVLESQGIDFVNERKTRSLTSEQCPAVDVIIEQLGQDIDGEASDDYSGWSVSLSSDGRTLAIGAPGNDGNGKNSGHVRVYSRDGVGEWIQKGADIDGEASNDQSGKSVSLSADGRTLAIGAVDNTGNNAKWSGHVRVYGWDETAGTNGEGEWIQKGADINGEASGDESGTSISLSDDGVTLAIGARYNNGNGKWSGHVRVYSWDETAGPNGEGEWIKKGTDIDGEAEYDQSGKSVSLSSDGRTLAIGAEGNDGNGYYDSGHVRVYSWDETAGPNGEGEWIQKGADIDGEASDDSSGRSVSLSADGLTLAIGAPFNDGNGDCSGHVRVYSWDETAGTNGEGEWIQKGTDIDGEASYDYSGSSVSLSADGLTLAIGARYNNGNGKWSGHVRVYSWDETAGPNGEGGWIQKGADIDGEASNDGSGRSVSLSADGLTLAIGADYNSGGNGDCSGHVRVYGWDETAGTNGEGEWIQKGADIDGEASDDSSGWSVSLSADGLTLAIGADGNDGNGLDNSGHVRVYSISCPSNTMVPKPTKKPKGGKGGKGSTKKGPKSTKTPKKAKGGKGSSKAPKSIKGPKSTKKPKKPKSTKAPKSTKKPKSTKTTSAPTTEVPAGTSTGYINMEASAAVITASTVLGIAFSIL